MTPQEVSSAEDMRRIVEERCAKNVTIAISDMNGLLRGKYISRDKLNSVLDNGWGMPPLILALDMDDVIMDAAEGLDGSDGYADVMARALPETCREIPWESPGRNLLMLAEFAGYMEALGSGLYGIEHRIEPEAPMEGNVYDQGIPEGHHFPESFSAAIERFRSSIAARELFGDPYINVYATTRASQDREFRTLVTDAELRRFFELA